MGLQVLVLALLLPQLKDKDLALGDRIGEGRTDPKAKCFPGSGKGVEEGSLGK